MLVLSRKLNEQIRIGDDITITILGIKGRTVRVGIEAPRQVRVLRSELQRVEDEAGDAPPVPVDASTPEETAPTRSTDGDRRRSAGADRRTGYLVAALGRNSPTVADRKKTPPPRRSSRRSANRPPEPRKRPGLPR